MKLDDRSNTVLDELINNPSTNSKDLEKKYGLTRRQLGYTMDKINQWLLENKLPVIERTRKGHFIIDQSVFTGFSGKQKPVMQDISIVSEKQRMYMIVMMMLSQNELSLNHFTSELKVSKNTILADLKRAQRLAEQFGLAIRYSRRAGYLIEGKEFHVRRLLTYVVGKMLEMPSGDELLLRLAEIKKTEISKLHHRIELVEQKLNLKFTDEKMTIMPYILVLVLRRINKGHAMTSFHIDYETLSDTKEYAAAEEILYDVKEIPAEERLFITLHFLTMNVHSSELLTDHAAPKLKQAVNDMLRLFEKKAIIFFQDREQLLHKLLLHVRPAYYRIKYQLTELNDQHDLVSKEYMELHHLVQQSTQPLEDFIGEKIPENETAYLTMLIGGWLTRQGDSIQEKTKAVVVCPKGVSVSRLMFSELRELFPEFIFLDSLSVREFKNYQLDYDIVFSPVLLDTDKKFFQASSFLSKAEKHVLRRQVMLEMFGYLPTEIDMDELMAIIEKEAVIKDDSKLRDDLYRYIHRDETASIKKKEDITRTLTLKDLITPDTITLKNSVASWEEAIQAASEPLIASGAIQPEYVDAMIHQYDKDPYIVIGPNFAIPHAAPDEGVNEVSMSLLRLKEGVDFTEDYSINIIVVIAAEDKQKHLKALMQLMKLAGDEADRQAIIQHDTKEDIFEIIKSYS
ncbi:BglG family transcription antiterminator [Virgibacillus sp. YIM 98842]|uniref:BglG family transcription antiterminator n=1 Tax=Virgibacillus sp. YIM 98842 TaxID=2663533 RepID=UPI0013D8F351|nr:BglG family transcription antiterminator [Virgibacillus sp. YIM 98842]